MKGILDETLRAMDTESSQSAPSAAHTNLGVISNPLVGASLIGDDFIPSDDEEKKHHEKELFGLHKDSDNKACLFVLTKLSVPVVISFFLQVGATFINLVFAGTYTNGYDTESTVFTGVSLSNMFANVTCLSILIGMTGAIETLASQHNGAENYKEVGYVLQRSCVILGLIMFPVIILWFYAGDIFLALGVDKHVCEVIRAYIRVRCLSIPMDVVNESYEKYLTSLGVMEPPMWANITFNVLVLVFNVLFVFVFKLDYICLAWSWVLALYISAAVQIKMSLKYTSVIKTLQPWNYQQAFSKWKEFFNLGLPGTIMLCSEWYAYEILTIFASRLGTVQVSAQSIILQTAELVFMAPLGIGVACASLVGNSLGAKKHKLAISIGKMSMVAVLILQVFIGLIILLFGQYFIAAFTDDPKVEASASRSLPFLAVFVIIDGLQGVASGILRGAGRQLVGAIANVVSFYIIGIPLAWLFCFTFSLGVNGLLLGVGCGTAFQVTVLAVLIFKYESYVFASAHTVGGGAVAGLIDVGLGIVASVAGESVVSSVVSGAAGGSSDGGVDLQQGDKYGEYEAVPLTGVLSDESMRALDDFSCHGGGGGGGEGGAGDMGGATTCYLSAMSPAERNMIAMTSFASRRKGSVDRSGGSSSSTHATAAATAAAAAAGSSSSSSTGFSTNTEHGYATDIGDSSSFNKQHGSGTLDSEFSHRNFCIDDGDEDGVV